MRYAAVKNSKICFISNEPCHSNLQLIEIPIELNDVPSTDLISCRVKNGQILYKSRKKPVSQKKIALVGNWKMKCGIATYSESLWGHVIKHVGDFKLFVEDQPNIGSFYEIGGKIIPPEKVSVCWKRGDSLKELISQIKEYDPDIVWIQHEFGLWPNACYWLSMMSQLFDYRVIVTMHSVYHHKDKTIVEAAIPEIVVHLSGARDMLKNQKQIPGQVYVISHGCDPCLSKDKLWNFYKSEKTFMQFGFGFRYKGWENSIRATAFLKQKYPDVFFTALFSESPLNKIEHQIYFNELMDLVDELDLHENVALIRGFQSDETLNSYLRTNQATIFHYVSHPSHEVFGASGAARLAMSKGLPVVTSSVNHFSDLPTVKADTPEQMAAALEELFNDPLKREAQINRQINYLDENTWENIALRYIEIFEINDKK